MPERPERRWRWWRRRGSPGAGGGAAAVALLVAAALAAPWLAPHDPLRQVDPAVSSYLPPGAVLEAVELAGGGWLLAERVERRGDRLVVERLGRRDVLAASEVRNLTETGVADRWRYWLGTDRFGRDLLSRILHGARVSLLVAAVAVAMALGLGILVGSVAAVGPAPVDAVLMRGVDALLAFPWLFLALVLTALFPPGLGLVVLVLGATSWMGMSRLVRAELLSLERREFVLAARALGFSPARVLLRHQLPHALNPVLVQATLLVGQVILVESALSFLGLGVQPPVPSWGNMVADGRSVLVTAWWVSTFPGLAIAVTVIAVNLLGDELRDRLDPRSRRRLPEAGTLADPEEAR